MDQGGQTLSVANLHENDDVISRFTYTYDPVGNRTQEMREDGDLRVFGYDPTNQLISEQRTEGESWSTLTTDQWGGMGVNDWGILPATSSAGPITTYVYDPVGNRLVLNVDGELTTSTYDAANRLLTVEDINGITTYTFDASGNQRTVETPSNDITTYSWTYENQLAQLEEPDDVVTTYVYAPTNRRGEELRLIKETDTGTVNYLWDDQNLIQEVDDTSTIEAEYTLNPQPYGDLVSQRRDDESTFYHFDALGSTQSLTDQTGTVENEYTYTAFGKELSSSGSVENPFTWVGELGYYKDADGRYSLRRREYEEGIARFLSEDPIRADDGTQYWYADNNLLNVVDPSGREGLCIGFNCTQPIENQGSAGPVDYDVLKDLFPKTEPEVTVAKQDLKKIPKGRVDELLKNKADTQAEELKPQEGRRVVSAMMLVEGVAKRVLLVQNVRLIQGCTTDAGPGGVIILPDDTFAVVASYPATYGTNAASEHYFGLSEQQRLEGQTEILETVLKALPFGTAMAAVTGTCEVDDWELGLVTVADSVFLVGGIVGLVGKGGQTIFTGARATMIARGAVGVDAGQNIIQAGIAAHEAVDDPTAGNIMVAAAITTAILFGVAWKKSVSNINRLFNRWIGSKLSHEATEELYQKMVSRMKSLKAGNYNAVDNAQGVGSRFGSNYRGRGPTCDSDLDLAVHDFIGLKGSRHEINVITKIKSIANDFTEKTGIRVEIHLKSSYRPEEWIELFGSGGTQ